MCSITEVGTFYAVIESSVSSARFLYLQRLPFSGREREQFNYLWEKKKPTHFVRLGTSRSDRRTPTVAKNWYVIMDHDSIGFFLQSTKLETNGNVSCGAPSNNFSQSISRFRFNFCFVCLCVWWNVHQLHAMSIECLYCRRMCVHSNERKKASERVQARSCCCGFAPMLRMPFVFFIFFLFSISWNRIE